MKEGGKERKGQKKEKKEMGGWQPAGVADSTAVCGKREKFKIYFLLFERVFELILVIYYY